MTPEKGRGFHAAPQLLVVVSGQPSALVDVVTGGPEVGHHSGPSGRRGDEPEETGVIVTHCKGENFARGPFNDLHCRLTSFGRILHQLVYQPLPELSGPGMFSRQVLDSLYHQLCRLAGQIKHQLGGHPEAITLFAVGVRT